AGTDSMGKPLDASILPFVVVPVASNGFDFMAAGLQYGSVVAVIYEDKLVYAIVGDQGDKGIVGEGSYALATLLGVPNDPQTGGVGSGVTYILFTGGSAVVQKPEDNTEATTLGEKLARMLIQGQ